METQWKPLYVVTVINIQDESLHVFFRLKYLLCLYYHDSNNCFLTWTLEEKLKKTVMVQEYLKVEEGLHENPDYLWNKAKVTAQYMKQLQKT